MFIIGILGNKESGKDTVSKYILGEVLKSRGVVEKSEMGEDGKLMVNCVFEDGKEGMGEFSLERFDSEFLMYLDTYIHPHVKKYAFADKIKLIIHDLYGIPLEDLYSRTGKNKKTDYQFKVLKNLIPEDVRPGLKDNTKLTIRQFMQYFADVLRSVNPNCFIDSLMRQIAIEQSPVTIISDVRYQEEVLAVQKISGKVIGLTRTSGDIDNHTSEKGTDYLQLADVVIDNQNMTVRQQNEKVSLLLKEWSVL